MSAIISPRSSGPALLPLPVEPFPSFREARRTVHRDGHVEVDRAYYSVPPEYLARQVWVRWDARLVRIFNDRMEPVAVHVKQEPGRFSTQAVAHRRGEDQRRRAGRGLAPGPGAAHRPAKHRLGRGGGRRREASRRSVS